MKIQSKPTLLNKLNQGMTLIELSMVMAVILSLGGIVTYASMNQYYEWKRGSEAGLLLREVDYATKLFLSDRPRIDPASFQRSDVARYLSPDIKNLPAARLDADGLPYLPNQSGTYNLTINFSAVLEPTASQDFSSQTDDSLWDIGK
jgi:prepilin-type N-terminal cleavage/methylation domain-containing protein